jgi:hypothetical protein
VRGASAAAGRSTGACACSVQVCGVAAACSDSFTDELEALELDDDTYLSAPSRCSPPRSSTTSVAKTILLLSVSYQLSVPINRSRAQCAKRRGGGERGGARGDAPPPCTKPRGGAGGGKHQL